MPEVFVKCKLIYVGPDIEKNIHFYVKKDRWPSIVKVLTQLRTVQGKEVNIIIREWLPEQRN